MAELGSYVQRDLTHSKQGSFNFRSCESVWTCKRFLSAQGFSVKDQFLRTFSRQFFPIEKPPEIAGVKRATGAADHGALLKDLRGAERF